MKAWLFLLASFSSSAALCAEITPKIIGGKVTGDADAPWQVAIVKNLQTPYQSYHCSGILIHQNWILTAAHCANTTNPLYVLLGTNDLLNAHAKIITTGQKITHPHFNAQTLDYDLALIQLDDSINTLNCGSDCAVATIAKPSDNVLGQDLVVSGWGKTSLCQAGVDNCLPSTLHSVSLSLKECLSTDSFYLPYQITKQMICASGRGESGVITDSCEGDSGGGLIWMNNGTPIVVGITSWGSGCGREGYAGVYADVASMSDWIQKTITPDSVVANPVAPEQFELTQPAELIPSAPQNLSTSHANTTQGGSISMISLILLVLLGGLSVWFKAKKSRSV